VSSGRIDLGSSRLRAWSALAGAGVAGAFCFYFAGMRTGSVAVAATLLYSASVFVFLAEFLSGRQRLTVDRTLGLGVLGGGFSFLCYIVGLRHSPAGAAALLGMAEPITAAAFGLLVLEQTLTPRQVLGAVVVIATVTALNRRSDI
jgi:drug/metabolite transporter (DMT)-like permease